MQTQLGRRIRRTRRDLDMTQVELAQKTGVAQVHISAIETGRIEDIKTDTLWRLATALRVTTDFLLEREAPLATKRTKRGRRVPVNV